MARGAAIDDPTIPDDPNPFNPGFGVDPPHVAGRAGIIHRLLANLNDGPGRATYLNVVVGSRGVGKTVLLNRLQQHVEDELGWPVLRWTAGPDASFAAALADEYDRILTALHRARRSRLAGGRVGVSAGVVSADVELAARDVRPTTVPAMLRRLGEQALERGKQVVLLVDEVQAGNPREPPRAVGRAAGDQRRSLAGRPRRRRAAEHVPAAARRRGDHVPRAPATGGDREPRRRREPRGDRCTRSSTRAGGSTTTQWTRSSSSAAATRTRSSSLRTTRGMRRAGARTITLDHARAAIALAGEELDDLYEARWDRLSPVLQEYLSAVVAELDAEGRASTGAVARRMARPVTQVAKQRDALIVEHQLLQPEGRGFVSVSLPGMTEWVRRRRTKRP